MLKHVGTLIAAASLLFSLFRSPVRTLAIAALLGGLWWYHARAGELRWSDGQFHAASQSAVTSRPPNQCLVCRD